MSRRKLDEGDRFQSDAERDFMQGKILPTPDDADHPPTQSEPDQPSKSASKPSPWAGLEPEAKEPTIRLNVDIPISLNDKLADKARKLRQPKTELVRRLLEWALNESVE